MPPISENWLYRGAQSAIFYYVSCGPCFTVMYKRQRRKDAERARQRAVTRKGVYSHPAPFETNKHWQDDIDLGPLPPHKRARKTTHESTRRRNSLTSQKTAGSQEVSGQGGAVVQVPREAYLVDGTGMRRKRYRRPDEEIHWADGSSEDEEVIAQNRWDYRLTKAPSVNDLHPAVVSVVPPKSEDRRWMKLPPPSTEYLNGRKGVTILERTDLKRTRDDETLQREPKQPNRLAGTDFDPINWEINGHLKPPGTSSRERIGTPVSRPGSAVSTSRPKSKLRHRHHRGAPSISSTSVSSSDADDEDDSEDATLPARPRAVYKSDGMASRLSSKRSVNRPALPTVLSNEPAIPVRTPTPGALRDRANSENVSPRPSPRSALSAGSPLSSENESLPPPHIQPQRPRIQVLSSRSNSSSQALSQPSPTVLLTAPKTKPKRAHSQHNVHDKQLERQLASLSLSGQDAQRISGTESYLFDSVVRSDEDEDPLAWQDLEEQKARERIWLGARERLIPTKRWSTDF